MYIFRLFKMDDPVTPIDARLLAEGRLMIGRAPSADWVMIDPACEISREHLTMRIDNGRLVLNCTGANGVYDDETQERLPNDEDLALTPPRAIRLGPYRMVAERAPQAAGGASGDGNGTLLMSLHNIDALNVPSDWADTPSLSSVTAGTMVDAFCEGAGLEASMFGAEDPAEILRRAGAVYRQMVLGVGDLMAERERVRSQYRLAQTTIGGTDNNPFKWAPTQRLAVDLLLANEKSFLSGAEALKASFCDIKKHLVATYQGFQSSLRVAIASFDPVEITKATEGLGTLFKTKTAMHWDESSRRHSQFSEELEGKPGALNEAFVKGYAAASSDLESQQP